MRRTELLIVGAAPYGLATAAYAETRGVDHLLLGEPMEFWYRHMPDGMLLRSGPEWHIDPFETRTVDAYLGGRRSPRDRVTPLAVGVFREYGEWFATEYDLRARPAWVKSLQKLDDSFQAELVDGQPLYARNVLLALGFASFAKVPNKIVRDLPVGCWSHTCDTVRFDQFREQRCLIVGGRQSGYEWAALLAEHGAAEVHISHRHPTPSFTPADWSWVADLVRRSNAQPAWYAQLSPAAREDIGRRFWREGRLKLEPWLEPRLNRNNIRVWECTSLTSCRVADDGTIIAELDAGPMLTVDHVILATGYRVDLAG
ncbi:MAG: NAD(P)-binding domain-containing protein [Chloroflexi bacterium]|nr:NAD(P)-binding domain-containing protein [Chloroflexota bacterium]